MWQERVKYPNSSCKELLDSSDKNVDFFLLHPSTKSQRETIVESVKGRQKEELERVKDSTHICGSDREYRSIQTPSRAKSEGQIHLACLLVLSCINQLAARGREAG